MHQHEYAQWLLATVSLLMLAHIKGANATDISSRPSTPEATYWVEQIADHLNFPSSIAWLPTGDMLITERMGGLRTLRHHTLLPEAATGVPLSFQDVFDGLKSVVVDPHFEANETIYLFLSEGTFEQRHAAVYRARYASNRLSHVVRIFRSKDDFGGFGIVAGRMTLLTDRTLLLSIPEDHHGGRAQQLDSHFGKLIRINLDGSAPRDNPFVNRSDAYPEIWSYGHRTPLGLYQDPSTGTVWEVEAGERGGDELNLIRPGANYGWPKASWGFAYGSGDQAATPMRSIPGMENAIHLWMPSATPSSISRYHGKVYPVWNGDFFIGHLTDRLLERIRIEDGRVVLQEKMLLDLKERVREVQVGPDNHIYLLTDHQNGRVLRLRPGRPTAKELPHVARKLAEAFTFSTDFPVGGDEQVSNLQPQEIQKGRQAFVERCASCHSIAEAVQGGKIGPDLAGVYGSRMGHRAGFDYSINMAGGVLTWDFGTLNRFLANPPSLVPGTTMASPPMTDAQLRRYIIGFLRQQ